MRWALLLEHLEYSASTGTGHLHIYCVSFGTVPCDQCRCGTVSVSGQPIAGNDASTTPCSSDAEFALFPLLGFSVTPTGSWSDPSGSATTGNFTPGTSPDGAYTYTVLGTAPCTTVSAVVTVNTTAAADPRRRWNGGSMQTANPVDLFGELSGAPSPGGTWTTSNGSPYSALLDPSTAASGNYTYTLPPNGPCAAASAQVSVTIAEAPDAGSSSAMSICSTAADLVLLPELGGTPDPGHMDCTPMVVHMERNSIRP